MATEKKTKPKRKKPHQHLINERHYIDGSRAAWSFMLTQCLQHLGESVMDAGSSRWVVEREEARLALRRVCEEFGDANWTSDMNLADVIEKHLVPYIKRRKS